MNTMIQIVRRIILFIIRIFRQALCCFSRKRVDTDTNDGLEVVNVINDSPKFSKGKNVMERDWNSWDDKPRTVEEHIEQYRENLVKPKEPEVVVEETLDLFADMAPKIERQKKVYLNKGGNENSSNFSRLEATATAEIPTFNELEDWTDENSQSMGWEEIDEQNTKQLIRETRKEMRAAKHKQSVR